MSSLSTFLDNTDRADLVELWCKHHQSNAPKGISKALLQLSAAYHLQARRSHGKAASIDKILAKSKGPNNRQMESGALLVREWHGKTYKVEVLDQGYQLDGKTFRSLSQIARHITGTRWSGPRFFGLRNAA